jgi:prolyl-tRNA synthetase
MRYSKLFGKTVREPLKDMTQDSHKLLYQAGYIRESTAGRYYLLPLGQRVFDKIVKIVEEEMDKSGAQKMSAPVLHPIELWEETNRDKSGGYELMTVEDRRGAKFALGGTAEEMFVDVVRRFQLTYKDMPFNVYQMGYKFRDELRARGGLLRVREFIMKDAYSFHTDDQDFKKEYENMRDTYSKIYTRVGLKFDIVPADNGYFGGEYCHEFVVESEVGESKYFVSEDANYIGHEDVAEFKLEEVNPDEELKPMEIVEQPEWVKTMDDNIKNYKLPAERFLKNVVYKNRVDGKIYIVTIRGDLQVNKNKLEKLLNLVGLLDDATAEDINSIGSKPGWVHSWGYENFDVTFVADNSLKTVNNFIGGQKEETTDSINVNYERDFKHEIEGDVAHAQSGFLSPDGKSKLLEKKGIEVGNIFQLGQHYSKKMQNAVFVDSDGKSKEFYMGCYGIGLGRTLATIVEVSHDEKGIIWPDAVAPYQVHLLGLNLEDSDIKTKAEGIYKTLIEKGIEVLFDDREGVNPGSKFADADLIGIPWRMVISKRTGDAVELKRREDDQNQTISIENALNQLLDD